MQSKDTSVNTAPFSKAFASKGSGLGAPKRYFPVRKLSRAGSLAAFFILLGGSVLIFLDGLTWTYQAYQKHGPATIEHDLALPGMVALVLFLAGLAAGWWAYVNWSKGVLVYEHGFAIHDRKGLHLWRWENIVALTAVVTQPCSIGNSAGITRAYCLTNRQNQRLVLSDVFSKVEQLAKIIQDAITPILYAQAAQQYNAGQVLVFGPVTISKGGIQIGKKTYAWAQVQQVSIQRGILRVSKKEGGWFSGASVSVSVIPNLNVLLNMIHQLVGLKVSSQ
jgi:hypothetical protein